MLSARELLDMKRPRALHWIDTRDTISDGLNKGSVDRAAIQQIWDKNLWEKIGGTPCSISCFVGEGAAGSTRVLVNEGDVSPLFELRQPDVVVSEWTETIVENSVWKTCNAEYS